MKRKNESSSLELLLDTMCNTFGGVMFIAITLAVVIFSREAMQLESEAIPENNVQELQNRIEILKNKLLEAKDEIKELEKVKEVLAKDPRMKLLGEIALLEQELQNKEKQKNIFQNSKKAAEAELAKSLDDISKLESLALNLNSKTKELQDEQDKLQEKMDSLKAEMKKLIPKQLTFTVLEEKNKIPFFVLIKNGKFWKIGPNISNGRFVPDDDVIYENGTDGHSTKCTPKSDHGKLLLNRDKASSEMLSFLRNIPSDRAPQFIISPADADNFYKLREQLKQKRTLHGFLMQENVDSFTYGESNNVKYEY